jgi:hypothetical protein
MISDASARWSLFSRRLSQIQLDFRGETPIFMGEAHLQVLLWQQEDYEVRQPTKDS